jgi:S-adenosyl methyltransferase
MPSFRLNSYHWGEGGKATDVFRKASSQLHIRPLPEVVQFFDGFELIEPGLT